MHHEILVPVLQVKLHGLTVAYLDGTYNAVAFHQGALASDTLASKGGPYYSSADVAALKRALEELEGEVDILLTAEWPKGITRGGWQNLPWPSTGTIVTFDMYSVALCHDNMSCSLILFMIYPTTPLYARAPLLHSTCTMLPLHDSFLWP